MSRIQEHGLCIKAGHGFLFFGNWELDFAYIKYVFLCYVYHLGICY